MLDEPLVRLRFPSLLFASTRFYSLQLASIRFNSLQFASTSFYSLQLASTGFYSLLFASTRLYSLHLASFRLNSLRFNSIRFDSILASIHFEWSCCVMNLLDWDFEKLCLCAALFSTVRRSRNSAQTYIFIQSYTFNFF